MINPDFFVRKLRAARAAYGECGQKGGYGKEDQLAGIPKERGNSAAPKLKKQRQPATKGLLAEKFLVITFIRITLSLLKGGG